jgi:FAD/FMN-containing dehydrogenase
MSALQHDVKSVASAAAHGGAMTLHTAFLAPDVVAELRRRVTGRIAYPADAHYAELVTGHDLASDHRPAVVVEPVDASDVREAVAIAAAHHLTVAVQATGHGTGHPVRGGLMLATRRLQQITVDPDALTVTVGAGVTWGPVASAVAEHGLMAVTTNGPGVGVVGSTLGGGVGPLARSHGFAAEHVVAIDAVTPDGVARHLTPGSDLFWAICGGRDGIAVVTAMTLRLQPAADLWGGELVWTGPALDDALTWWHELAAHVPDTVTTSAMVGVAPDVEEVPPPLRGQAMLRVTICAAAADATRLEADIAAAPTPAMAALAPLTIAEFLERHGDVAPPMPTWQRGFALVDLTTETHDVIRALAGPASGAPLIGAEIRRLGGALGREADDAISGRDAQWLLSVIGAPVPELFAEVLPALAHRLEAALEPWSTGGSVLNFHGRPGAEHELDRAWPAATHARLLRIRADVDPEGALTRGRADLPS